jgi:hypothetical protein
MGYKGVARGKTIELDEPLPFSRETRVEVTVTPESSPPKGSPKAILRLAGTLTYEEAEAIPKTTPLNGTT